MNATDFKLLQNAYRIIQNEQKILEKGYSKTHFLKLEELKKNALDNLTIKTPHFIAESLDEITSYLEKHNIPYNGNISTHKEKIDVLTRCGIFPLTHKLWVSKTHSYIVSEYMVKDTINSTSYALVIPQSKA